MTAIYLLASLKVGTLAPRQSVGRHHDGVGILLAAE